MRLLSLFIIISIHLSIFTGVAIASQFGTTEPAFTDRQYWSDFKWDDIYNSKLFKSIKWAKADTSIISSMNTDDAEKGLQKQFSVDIVSEYSADTLIDGMELNCKVREFKSKQKYMIVLSKDQQNRKASESLLRLLTIQYGYDYILNNGDSLLGMKTYQWVVGNTVIDYIILGKESLSLFISFSDRATAKLAKPEIILKCAYRATDTGLDKRQLSIFVISQEGDDKYVKNEDLSEYLFKSKLSENTITMYINDKERNTQLNISRITGKLSGYMKSKTKSYVNMTVEGNCEKLDALEKKF